VSVRVSPARFEQLVAEALDSLPEPFASHLENVDVVVEDEPSSEDLGASDLPPGNTLFGLYQGIPQTERGPGYTFVMPDKITIFRGPILRACSDEDDGYGRPRDRPPLRDLRRAFGRARLVVGRAVQARFADRG
jgi:predicted Zn-dependent protease with MMP-like domain